MVALGGIRLQEDNLFKGLSLTPSFSHLSAGLTSKSCKLHEIREPSFLSVTDTPSTSPSHSPREHHVLLEGRKGRREGEWEGRTEGAGLRKN